MAIYSFNHEQRDMDDILGIIIALLKQGNTDLDIKIPYQICGWGKDIKIKDIDVDFLNTLTDVEATSVMIRLLYHCNIENKDLEFSHSRFLSNHYVEIDGIKNCFMDLYYLFGPLMYFIDEDVIQNETKLHYVHISRFCTNFMYRLDPKYNWVVIFKFNQNDEKNYFQTDYKKEFQELKKSLDIKNTRVIKDVTIKNVLLIPHCTEDDLLTMKLSLSSDYKIFSWINVQNIIDAW